MSTSIPSNPILIVGGGLAGLSAAHQAYLRGANVVLLDKESFLSGNSGKSYFRYQWCLDENSS